VPDPPDPPDPADPARVPVRPLDPPMLPFTAAGTGLWAVAGVALVIAGGPASWQWTCLAGFLLGLAGLPLMAVHDRRRRSRRRR